MLSIIMLSAVILIVITLEYLITLMRDYFSQFNDAACYSEEPSYSKCHFAEYLKKQVL